MKAISLLHELMMPVRVPQASIAAKKPAISISCFCENRWGMEMGSSFIKEGWLYCAAFALKKSIRSGLLFFITILRKLEEDFLIDELLHAQKQWSLLRYK